MPSNFQSASTARRHHSPPLGLVAIAFPVVFCAGLYPVKAFGGRTFLVLGNLRRRLSRSFRPVLQQSSSAPFCNSARRFRWESSPLRP